MNKDLLGKGIGWLAFICAIIAFFWQVNIMAGVAIGLSIIGYFLKTQTTRMSFTATGMAIVAILIGMISY